MTDLAQLIADLESAQVGSLHYDKRILAALGFTWRGMAYWNSQEQWKGSAALTQSIDAIVALIERKLPGWVRSIDYDPTNSIKSAVSLAPTFWPHWDSAADVGGVVGGGATEPLAACSALLRALQAQQETS